MSREIRQAETRLVRQWLAQHQRLISALGKQTRRNPVIVERDFHFRCRKDDPRRRREPDKQPCFETLGLLGTALAAVLALTM
jgi:hypothetical protein